MGCAKVCECRLLGVGLDRVKDAQSSQTAAVPATGKLAQNLSGLWVFALILGGGWGLGALLGETLWFFYHR